VWGSRAHVEVLAGEKKPKKKQTLEFENEALPELRSKI
jgi:hypothetical protein